LIVGKGGDPGKSGEVAKWHEMDWREGVQWGKQRGREGKGGKRADPPPRFQIIDTPKICKLKLD